MRKVHATERNKRGCRYCSDMVIAGSGAIRTSCPHEQCPYHVLEKYETYEDYMASEDSKILGMVFPQIYDGNISQESVQQIKKLIPKQKRFF